jgi:hypothetical protein
MMAGMVTLKFGGCNGFSMGLSFESEEEVFAGLPAYDYDEENPTSSVIILNASEGV